MKSKIQQVQEMISEECRKIESILLQKNKEYGNSAIEPPRIFSSASNMEQINVRIDDKLSRIKNRDHKDIKEDTVTDLIGYLILKKVVQRILKNEEDIV